MENFLRLFFCLPFLPAYLICVSANFVSTNCLADDQTLIKDLNGDGKVSILAFGDSITYGIGNRLAPGVEVEEIPRDNIQSGGYPSKIQELTNLPVRNAGFPGEQFVSEGSDRFVRAVSASDADIVVILEGSNDANLQAQASDFRNKLQRSINAAIALGRQPVVVAVPPACCNRESLNPFLDSFRREQLRLSDINAVPYVDLERSFNTSCAVIGQCLNVPEGLHPNSRGYTMIAQSILGTLYGVDIFANEGASDLAGALGVDPTTIIVKPDSTTAAQEGEGK